MCASDRSQSTAIECGPFRLNKKKDEIKFKTSLCRHYQAFGSCSYGNQCGFAHGTNELRPMSNLYKTRLCNTWLSGQECKFGSKCMFAHGAVDMRMPKLLQPCHLFIKNGVCAYGEQCLYSHDTHDVDEYKSDEHETRKEIVARPVTPESSPLTPSSSPPGAPVKRTFPEPSSWSPFKDDNFGTSLLNNVSKQLFKVQL